MSFFLCTRQHSAKASRSASAIKGSSTVCFSSPLEQGLLSRAHCRSLKTNGNLRLDNHDDKKLFELCEESENCE
jgi:hypothetical protein